MWIQAKQNEVYLRVGQIYTVSIFILLASYDKYVNT